jgi:hypothetical protein
MTKQKQELLAILERRGYVVHYRAGCCTLHKSDFRPEELAGHSCQGLIQKVYWRTIHLRGPDPDPRGCRCPECAARMPRPEVGQ